MGWTLKWRRTGTDEPNGRIEEPEPEAELSEFDRHTLWADHARWAMDHIQHRLELAGQLAIGAIGIQGVLLTIVAATFDETTELWALRFNALAMTGLVAATGIVLFGAFPRKVSGINPDVYREGWIREMANPWHSPNQQFAEELLQTASESDSPLVSADGLVERRMTWVRIGLIVSGLSLVSLALGTLWPVIGKLL